MFEATDSSMVEGDCQIQMGRFVSFLQVEYLDFLTAIIILILFAKWIEKPSVSCLHLAERHCSHLILSLCFTCSSTDSTVHLEHSCLTWFGNLLIFDFFCLH